MAAAETASRPASRLELIRARLRHETAARRQRASPVREDHDVLRPHATSHNGVLPATARPGAASRPESKPPDRKLQSGVNTNRDRQQLPAVSHHQPDVRGRSQRDIGVDGQEYAQVRKPAAAPASADREQNCRVEDAGHQLTPAGHKDSTPPAKPRRLQAQKTSFSSSSSLLSKSQNFFARLRSRKNDPSKTTPKSASKDGGSSSNTQKIRRSISESGCAMYANRAELGDSNENMSPRSAHADVLTSSDDVSTERRTVDKPEAVDCNAVADSTNDHVTTASVYAKVEPLTRSVLTTAADVVQPTAKSTSGPEQASSSSVYEECAGSYSLREALLQRGADCALDDPPPTSPTSSHVIRPASDDDQVTLRTAVQTSASVLPVSDGCSRSISLSGWRRRKLATTHSTGSMVGARLERIQEVDSPPGSTDDAEMSLRPAPRLRVNEQPVQGSYSTQRARHAHNCTFIQQ